MTTSRGPLGALARTWWLVPLAVAAALLTAWLLTRRQVPVHAATTSVVVVPEGTAIESVRDQIDALAALDRRNVVATVAGIAQSRELIGRAARRAGIADGEVRRYRVRCIVRPNTNILDIEALGPDPAACAQMAGKVASIAGDETTANYRIFRLRLLDEAQVPSRPVSPDLRRNLVVGGVLGLLAGLLPAAALDWSRRSAAAPRAS